MIKLLIGLIITLVLVLGTLVVTLQIRRSKQAQTVPSESVTQTNQHFSSQDATGVPVVQNDEMAKRGINGNNVKSTTPVPIPKKVVLITSAGADPKNVGTTAGGQVSFANKTGSTIELTEEKNLFPSQPMKENETVTYTFKSSGIFSFKVSNSEITIHVIVASN